MTFVTILILLLPFKSNKIRKDKIENNIPITDICQASSEGKKKIGFNKTEKIIFSKFLLNNLFRII